MIKTLTHDQFQEMLDSGEWIHETRLDIIENGLGQACVISTLNGITVTYKENFAWEDGDDESLSISTEGQDDVWKFEGVDVLVNKVMFFKDGEEYPDTEMDVYRHLDIPGDFSDTDYSKLEYKFK